MIKPLFQNILVVITGSEASINAVKYAVLMAKLYRCTVHAIYVVDTATIKRLTLNRIFIEEEKVEYEKNLYETGTRYLSYVHEIGAKKNIEVVSEIKAGSVSFEVLSYADKHNINAILIGSEDAQTDNSKNLMTKTFHSLLEHAKCSILLVNEKMIEQLYKIA